MRAHWITAALVSTVIAVGCGGANPPDSEETQPVAPPADSTVIPDEPVSPQVDTPAPDERRTPPPSRPSGAASTSRPPARPAPVSPQASARDERPATPPAPQVQYRNLTVPAGTALPLELLTSLSSETTTVESPVRARLKQAISVDGYSVLPVGTELTGTVTEVAEAGRVKGRARVTFVLDRATVAGARETLRTDPITFEAEPTKGEDATKIGAGAGIGAVIGGILGGGSGAAKGAAIGGAAGTGAVLATKGQHVEIAAGADIAASLAQPFEVRVRQ